MNIKASLLLVSMFLVAAFPASASLPTTPTPVTAKSTAPSTSQRCSRLTNDINARVKRYQENHATHVETYKGIKTKALNIVTKLEGKDYDLSALKENLTALDAKIAKFEKDYADYISKLSATKSFVCGQSEGQFAAKLKDARDALKLVNQDAIAIRNFYKSDIRPDIKSIRDQIKTNSDKSESETGTPSPTNQ